MFIRSEDIKYRDILYFNVYLFRVASVMINRVIRARRRYKNSKSNGRAVTRFAQSGRRDFIDSANDINSEFISRFVNFIVFVNNAITC